MEQTARILSRLISALPQHDVPTPTYQVYVQDLAEVPSDLLDEAVTWMIRTVPMEFRFPTIREIRQACAERLLHLPTEADALGQVNARIAWARECVGGEPPVHPLVHQALLEVGGFHAFRETEEPGVIRGQFLRIYRDLRADAMRRCQHDPALGTRSAIAAA